MAQANQNLSHHEIPVMSEQLPITLHEIDSQSIRTVSLRCLHQSLGVGRDFSNWAKSRIEKFGFIEGQDYVTTEDLRSPNPASAKSRSVTAIEYHASLDMAKELAMVENNEQGRAIRRYFIEAEKQLRSTEAPDLSNPLVLQQLLIDHVARRIEAERRAEAAEQIIENVRPKAIFYEEFANADGLFTLQNAARILDQGPNKFIGRMKQGYLFYQGGVLVPKAQFREMGIFEVKATLVKDMARYQTYVTPGESHILRRN